MEYWERRQRAQEEAKEGPCFAAGQVVGVGFFARLLRARCGKCGVRFFRWATLAVRCAGEDGITYMRICVDPKACHARCLNFVAAEKAEQKRLDEDMNTRRRRAIADEAAFLKGSTSKGTQ